MNIAWMIPCRFVEVHDNLATIVGAGIDTVTVPSLPAPVQVMLGIKLTGLADEFDESVKHSFTNRVRDPNGEVVGEQTGEMAIGVQSTQTEWLVGVTLPFVVQFDVSEAGTYTIEFIVGGAEAQIPFHIVSLA